MQATIIGKETVLEEVRVSVVAAAGQRGWVGFAFLRPGAEFSEGEYELRLEDGRSCAVQVVSVKDHTARFRGLGPLE